MHQLSKYCIKILNFFKQKGLVFPSANTIPTFLILSKNIIQKYIHCKWISSLVTIDVSANFKKSIQLGRYVFNPLLDIGISLSQINSTDPVPWEKFKHKITNSVKLNNSNSGERERERDWLPWAQVRFHRAGWCTWWFLLSKRNHTLVLLTIQIIEGLENTFFDIIGFIL